MADFLKALLIEERCGLGQDADLMEEMRDLHARLELKKSWKGRPFVRKSVNARLKNGDNLEAMHQQ